MIDAYYFSGRGNSLAVAKELASRISDLRLKKITADIGRAATEVAPASALGLVFPVIDRGMPRAVRAFIRSLDTFSSSPYAFAAITSGGMPAGILAQTRALLARRGIDLVAAAVLPFSLSPRDAEIRAERLAALSRAIDARAPLRYEQGTFIERVALSGAANFLAHGLIPHEAKKFTSSASCDGCGICARICPASNIAIESRRPRWGRKCEQCGACFAWCPKEAISGTCLAAKTRYRNPDVTLADMLANGPKEGASGATGSSLGMPKAVERAVSDEAVR